LPLVDARHALLGRLFDHAPLFPPAGMALPDARAEDERAQLSEDAWILNRFVCPADRLEELADWGRELALVAVGSCSFFEPVGELHDLGIL
jgi:hypothetical protein